MWSTRSRPRSRPRSRHRYSAFRRVCQNSGGRGRGRGRGLRNGDLNASHRRGYVLLETVIATGLLIVGLAVIGAQIQDSDAALKKMERKVRAVMLAELKLAELDMGVIKLTSVDDVVEGDFGPRYPDYGWQLISKASGIEGVYALTLDIMHIYHVGDWKPDDFDYASAEVVFATHTLHEKPMPFDLERDFGLPEDQLEDVSKQLSELSIPGLDISSLNLRTLAGLKFEDFVRALPVLSEVFGFNIDQLTGILPPQLRSLLEESGMGGDGNSNGNGNGDGSGQDSGQGNGNGTGTGTGDGSGAGDSQADGSRSGGS